ncbi:non-specific lipid transfer protein GPI-anchored 11-like [Phoenix dactylifera]|uniref:Non-specific lipid transfer protein GPI-anchored 11-like n=1 Tax=Phoenix dactylifera TaxID=42345 RepID=A0A8B7CZ88_PHODC|nr:non-specific lipid transfer protein GPI-anchored 11-like [Phoenix dactylifera]
MAARPKELVVLFMALWFQVIKGDGSSASSALNCSGAFFSFADCLEFVEDASMVEKPGKACCTGLEAVAGQSIGCLCEVLKDGSRFGIPINMTRALRLTSLCRAFAQPMEHCVIEILRRKVLDSHHQKMDSYKTKWPYVPYMVRRR